MEEDNMQALWKFMVEKGLKNLDQVPDVYKMNIYTELVQEGKISLEDIPESHRDRVAERLTAGE